MSSTILGGDVTVYWSTDNNQLRWEWTGTATGTRTMNEVYSAWKTLEALSANMDQRVGMTAQTPVDYTMVNGYFVDETTMEHQTGGTLQTSGWAAAFIVERPYDSTGGAATDFISSDIGKTIVGTTSGHSGTILDFNTVRGDEVVIIRGDTVTDTFVNDTEAFTVTTGTGAAIFELDSKGLGEKTGESKWANPNTIATLAPNTRVIAYQSRDTAVADAGADTNRNKVIAAKGTDQWWTDGNIDICLMVQANDVLFDEGFATFYAEQYTQKRTHAVTDLSAGARTPIALETEDDGNNTLGPYQFLTNAETPGADSWSSADVGVRINENIATPTWEAVLTSVTGSGPNYTMQYYLVGDQTQASASDVFEDLAATKTATITGAAPTAVNVNAAPINTITVTHTAVDRDLNNGAGSQPYSIEVDCQAEGIQDVYEYLKYETSRGITTTDTTDGIEGEQYIGNELHLNYSSLTGAFVEGEQLWMFNSGDTIKVATGIVVADHGAANDGGLQLRNVRRYTADVIGLVGDSETSHAVSTDKATVDTERTIAPVKAAVFGTFAGGTFFGAPGVWLADVGPGDEQSFNLIDDLGIPQLPPNTVSITVTNLVAGGSGAVYRRVDGTAGSDVDRAEFNPNATQGPVNSTTAGIDTITVTGTIGNDYPDAGKVMVVDVSNNNETLRYRYTSVTRASGIFTLTSSTGTADAGGSGTLLEDSAADFVTDGVEIGDIARNVTDGSEAIVTGITDLDTLTTTQLTGGGTNDWATSDSYEINRVARQYVTGDDVWVPIILEEGHSGTSLSTSLIHSGNIPVRVVVRDPGDIFPDSVDQTIEATGMSQAATRTTDTIFV